MSIIPFGAWLEQLRGSAAYRDADRRLRRRTGARLADEPIPNSNLARDYPLVRDLDDRRRAERPDAPGVG